jgi:ribosomal protein S11
MAIAHPIRFNALGAIQKCVRYRFSTSVRVRNDKPRSIPTTTQPPAPRYGALTQAPLEFLETFNKVITRGPSSGIKRNVQIRSNKDPDSFLPASMSEMPIPNPASLSAVRPSLPPVPTEQEPGYFHIHVVSVTKNTHITITDNKHNPVVAMSAGRLGLKHSKRNTQEAAFMTSIAAFDKLKKLNRRVDQVELVLKGFGTGRRGFLGAIAGPQGAFIKGRVVRVTDATPMRIGSTPSPSVKRR